MPGNPAAAAQLLNNPANTPALLQEIGKLAATRPAPIPFTPGQMPNLSTGKGEWAAINAKYAEGSPERAAGQMAILQQEYAVAPDAGTRTVLAREIKKAGGTIPDAAAMAQANNAPIASVAPVFSRQGDEATAPSTTTSLKVSPVSGAPVKSSKPVEIPANTEWKPPVTVTQAPPTAVPANGAKRAYLTFIPRDSIKDGDTVGNIKNPQGGVDDCRMDWIDAPESPKPWKGDPGQPGGEYAAKTLKDLMGDKMVTVRVTQEATKSNKGRLGCQFEIEGVNINEQMVQKAAGWLYREHGPKDSETYNRLSKMELQNQLEGKGIFEDFSAERPSKYRRRQPKTD